MFNTIEETKSLMKKYKIKASKRLGQNFLIDDVVLYDIVQAAQISENDLVIEIGPGLGNLTKLLLENAKKVICIELDDKMIQILKDRFISNNNLQIIKDDILSVNLKELINNEKKCINPSNIKIVANLPYYITTPIIMKLIEDNLDIESITVMVQKEVAERLIAIPGAKDSGAITYTVFYYCASEKILDVDKKSFIPVPKVDSSVIKLILRKDNIVNVKDKKIMFNIIKSAFMQRRKTLVNALYNVGVFSSKEQGIETLKKLGLREDIRPEALTIEDFAKITDEFLENRS